MSRLVIALGVFFTAFFASAVIQTDSLPPHLERWQAQRFRWLSGEAELTLPPPTLGITTLFIEAQPIQEHLEVVVSIAGEEVQRLLLIAGLHEYAISLPPSAIEDARQQSQPLRVGFRSTAYRPKDLTHGRSQDSRRLAFLLTRISYAQRDQSTPLKLSDAALFSHGVYAVEVAGGAMNFRGADLRHFFRSALFRWDSAWYRAIIERGYSYQAGFGGEQPVRFFPLYPFLCQVLRTMAPGLQFPVDLLMWGVANVCAIIAVCLFSTLARKTLPAEAAWTAVVLFCFFPGSLFFSLAYTESLMALLTILFLRYLQKQQFVAAALAAGLTTACRPTGVALIPAFVWAYYRDEHTRLAPIGRKLCSGTALLALSVSGLAAYMLYLQWRFGDPIAFARVPLALPSWSEDWKWAMLSGRPVWKPLLEALWHNPLLLFVIPAIFDALALATALLLLMAMLRWRAPSIWLILGFSLALMPYGILGGSSQGVAAMSRFLMVDIPLFLLGGLLLSKYRLHRALLGIAVLLAIVLFVFSALFASGEYFVG